MTIAIRCKCGKGLSVAHRHAGKRARCPACGQTLQIPKGSLAPLRKARAKRSHLKGRVLTVGVLVVAFVTVSLWWGARPDASSSGRKQKSPDDGIRPSRAVANQSSRTGPQTTGDEPKPVAANNHASPGAPSQSPVEPSSPAVEDKPSPDGAETTESSSSLVERVQTEVVQSGFSGPQTVADSSRTEVALGVKRTRREVEELIETVGRRPPEWYESTPLEYPKTLDLSWPKPPPKGWNNRKNVGQYIWDIINPNDNKWRSGVRFMHHMLAANKDDRKVVARTMNELGRMYHELLQDYARAAFWYQQAGIPKGSEFARTKNGAHLAECYWRLGNKQMAVDLLDKLPVTYATVKLWGDMGELRKASQLAQRVVRGGAQPNLIYLGLGDAYRAAGDFDQAIRNYRKVLDVPATGKRKERIEKDHNRARTNIDAIRAVERLDLARIPDGSYTASSLGYETQVQVSVAVAAGKITSVRVTRHREKQYYSSIADTTRKIVEQQGVQGVDTTSGATITSEAIINATVKALAAAGLTNVE